MKCKVKGEKYLILGDGERIPEEFNKQQVDECLESLIHAFSEFEKGLEHSLRDKMDAFSFISSNCFDVNHRYGLHDTILEEVNADLEELCALQTRLSNADDQVPDPEDAYVLEDYGFRNRSFGREAPVYGKVLVDNDEREVTEEVFKDTATKKYVHRLRTIIWRKEEFGKSSESITYEQKPMTEKLKKAFLNSVKYQKEG